MAAQDHRILVVEDEELISIDIQGQLVNLGYDVVAGAASAEEACRKASELRPDLVLVDIRLDGKYDGIEAAERIRLDRRIPIVFLTAYVDADTLQRAKAAQPHGYLVKPFDERELHTTIQIALHKGRLDRELEQSHENLLAVLDAQRHGTAMIDENGRLTFLSRSAQGMTGATAEHAVGRHWRDVLALKPPEQAELERTCRRPAPQRTKVPVCIDARQGRLRRLEIDVRDDPRGGNGKILFFYDVSREHELLRKLDQSTQFEQIVGKSKSIRHVFQLILDVALVDSTVLIEGETGTGKELVARAIHNRSRRKDKPFVALNCGGLNEELAASLLFGHRRGAFTDAVENRIGFFEEAGGGTLFLDEIGELPIRIQTVLLRVLEESKVRRLGDSELRPIDTRIIAATNRDLAEEAANDRFRTDLLYRIRVARIRLPALRDRREDLPMLVRHFLADHCATVDKRLASISDDAMSILMTYCWPGNVRELRNALEFALICVRGTVLQPQHLPPEILESVGAEGGLESAAEDEPARILAALQQTGGNRKEAAARLGISRATLYRRIQQFGIGDTTLTIAPSVSSVSPVSRNETRLRH